MTSSLSGESSSLEVGYLSFGSPVITSAVSKPIFEINTIEENTKITTPMFSGSGKNLLSFGSIDESASPKTSSGEFAAYLSTSAPRGFKFR